MTATRDSSMIDDRLITAVPQIDGGTRYIYARTPLEARRARRTIKNDPAMIDTLRPYRIVDVDRSGRREIWEA